MKVNEAFEDWATGGGIFSVLQSLAVPWQSSNIASSLDFVYHGNRSGDKGISPLVDKLSDGEPLTSAKKTIIANALMSVFGLNWTKEFAVLSAQYEPIENYNMLEQMTNDTTTDQYGKTSTRTDNLTHAKTGTETQTPNTTDTRTPNTTETRTPNTTDTKTPDTKTQKNLNVFGFNGTTGKPSEIEIATETGTEKLVRTGTETVKETGTETMTRTGTDTMTYNTSDTDTGTQAVVDSGTDTHTRNYKLTRSGNIGVTSSQQLLESEIKLWMWNFFTDVVFPDVDKFLALKIY